MNLRECSHGVVATIVVLVLVGSLPRVTAQEAEPVFLPPKKSTPTHLHPLPNSRLNRATQPPAAANPVANLSETFGLQPVILRQLKNDLIPAAHASQHHHFLSQLHELVTRLSEEELEACQSFAQARGVDLKVRFVELLDEALSRNWTAARPLQVPPGVRFLQSAIESHVTSELQLLEQFSPLDESAPVPLSWRDREQLFGGIAAWHRRLGRHERLAEYNELLQQEALARARKRKDQTVLAQLQRAPELTAQVRHDQRRLLERETELRLQDLQRAADTLASSEVILDKVYASMAMLEHHPRLQQIFVEVAPGQFSKSNLQDPGWPNRCDELVQTGRAADSDLFDKVVLFRDGLEWWLRGRYGRGELAVGLLKPDAATKAGPAMRGLFMPSVMPLVAVTEDNAEDNADDDADDSPPAPACHRRHYLTWAVNQNGLIPNSPYLFDEKTPCQFELVSFNAENSTWSPGNFGQRSEPEIFCSPTLQRYSTAVDDAALPQRLVGSFEYLNALGAFDRLVTRCSEPELDALDSYLQDRPLLSFCNGSNRDGVTRASLDQLPPEQRTRLETKYARSGLKWMMALARVELAATLSLHSSIERPFGVLLADVDQHAYLDILTDDAIAHLKSLAHEPGFQQVTERRHRADSWTMAYLRRIKMIRDMLQTLVEQGGPQVATEIAPYQRELAGYQRELIGQVYREVEAMVASQALAAASSSSATGLNGSLAGPVEELFPVDPARVADLE